MLTDDTKEKFRCQETHPKGKPGIFRVGNLNSRQMQKTHIRKFLSQELKRVTVSSNNYFKPIIKKFPDDRYTTCCMTNTPVKRTNQDGFHTLSKIYQSPSPKISNFRAIKKNSGKMYHLFINRTINVIRYFLNCSGWIEGIDGY